MKRITLFFGTAAMIAVMSVRCDSTVCEKDCGDVYEECVATCVGPEQCGNCEDDYDECLDKCEPRVETTEDCDGSTPGVI